MQPLKDIGFHGKYRSQFFEGWYFKLVIKAAHCTIALIPGLVKNKQDPHAFIQITLSPLQLTRYIRFEYHECVIQNDPFSVTLRDNVFSLHHVRFQYHDNELELNLDCETAHITPILTSWFAPTIMGPFYYVPRMQCNHGVISMNHELSGVVTLNGKTYSFENEKGYIEKDWGSSFPRKYIWSQANNFINTSASVFLSIATIPMVFFTFEGLIANITVDNKEYRFATYTCARFNIVKIDAFTRIITLTQGKLCATLTIHSSHSVALVSPVKGMMLNMIKEGLQGRIHLVLVDGNQVIFDGTSDHAGVEFSGY